MARTKIYMTRIKRGDLVSMSGVGSVIRTQNGVFGVVGSLADWERTLPIQAAVGQVEFERERYLREHEIRDPELEDACKVSRFIEPPSEPEDIGWNPPKPWEVPIFRFPLTEVCTNWQCQRVSYTSPGDAGRLKCRHSHPKGTPYTTQVPVYMVCGAGHLDEVPFARALPDNGCPHNSIKINFGSNPKNPSVKCMDCQQDGRLDTRIECTGRRPWINGSVDEECREEMVIVERTSVNTYFPSTKSSIHIPLDSDIDERVIAWLNRIDLRFFDRLNENNVRQLIDDATKAGFSLDQNSIELHLLERERRNSRHESTEEWDFIAARTNEFDVLAGHATYAALTRSRLLQFRPRNLTSYSHPLIGDSALITAITSVDVLTETRALDGFSRLNPNTPSPRDGYRLLWGFDRPTESWLPAYRLHGEGMFLQFDERLLPRGQSIDEPVDSFQHAALTEAGVFAHSFAHLLMKSLSKSCGYQLPSIRDRIYQLSDGRIGLLVYTAEGDIVGTLGGLVQLSEPGYLERLLDEVVEASRWCGQDPVCIEKIHSRSKNVGAACHQCLLLPETSCERFNSDLDRRLLAARLNF
jgi:hypothetical protein